MNPVRTIHKVAFSALLVCAAVVGCGDPNEEFKPTPENTPQIPIETHDRSPDAH